MPYNAAYLGALARLLKAWALVGAKDPIGVKAALSQPPELLRGLRQWYGVEQTLLAYSLHESNSAQRLLKSLSSVDGVEYERQLIYVPYRASLMARLGQRGAAEKFLTSFGETSGLARFLNPNLQPDPTSLPVSALSGAADTLLEYGLLLYSNVQPMLQRTLDKDVATNKMIHLVQLSIICERMALSLAPDLTPARIQLARSLGLSGEMEEARGQLRHVNHADAFAPWALYTRKGFEKSDSDLAAENKTLEELISVVPNDAGYQLDLATSQVDLGQETAALANLNRIVAAIDLGEKWDSWDPIFVEEVYYFRGQLYNYLGDRAKARDDFERALKIFPGSPELLGDAGANDLFGGVNLPKAMDRITRAYRLSPKNEVIRSYYAWELLVFRHDLKQALSLLQSAAKELPNAPVVAYHLGVAYWYSGEFARASLEFARALKNAPTAQTRRQIERALQEGPNIAGLPKPPNAPHQPDRKN